jgi:hypothetical protein
MRLKITGWLVMVGLLLAGGPSLAQTAQTPQPLPPAAQATAPEPDPRQVLQKMCDFLKSQPQFTVKAEVTDDQVYYGGKKLQYGLDMDLRVRRPDRLRVDAVGDLVDQQLYYDGKTITLYDKNSNVFGTLSVPPDIEGALEKANQECGLRVALTDLASPRLWELLNQRIQHALYVGLHQVRGVPCHHLSFDSGAAQLQLWVDAGSQPIPRKAVLTHKELPGSPQFTAYLHDWDFSSQLGDDLFAFTPPEGAAKIKFLPVKAPAGKPEKPKQGEKP